MGTKVCSHLVPGTYRHYERFLSVNLPSSIKSETQTWEMWVIIPASLRTELRSGELTPRARGLPAGLAAVAPALICQQSPSHPSIHQLLVKYLCLALGRK